MRLGLRDVAAGVFVIASTLIFAMWTSDSAFTGMTARSIAVVIFALGWAGCIANQSGMRDVYGAEGRTRSPLPYVIATSLLGTLALVAGIISMLSANEALMTTMVIALVLLFAMSTGRHAMARPMGLGAEGAST